MNYALILAGGKGVRFGKGDLPKQFLELMGIPMLVHSMRTAELNNHIDEIVVVSQERHFEMILNWAKQYNIKKLKYLSASGKKRCDSVFNGLCSIPANNDDTVMIMTSVCPLLSQKTMEQHYEYIKNNDGVITVVSATDAITYSEEGTLADRTLQKSKLFVQQGPQTYHYGLLKTAHDKYREQKSSHEVFEDSELVMSLGGTVFMVHGDRFCIKVTYPEDLAIAESLHPLFIEKERIYRDEQNNT